MLLNYVRVNRMRNACVDDGLLLLLRLRQADKFIYYTRIACGMRTIYWPMRSTNAYVQFK